MKILVTGSDGQLGKCIQDVAKEHKKIEFIFTDYLELDITDLVAVKNFFKEYKFDYCINCAAYTAVDKAEAEVEKAYDINAKGSKHLAETCKLNSVVLIHISTDFVFDGDKTIPYTENDIPNPINVYGASKLKGELYVQEILNEYFIIRTSWVYSEYGNNFVKTMLRLAKEKDEISVVNDQIGSPTYAGDLAEFLIFLIFNHKKQYGLYHYSNVGDVSWYEFATEIFKQIGFTIKVNPIPTKAYPTPAERPQNSELSKEKTEKKFHIQIPYWIDSLKRVLKVINLNFK